LIKAQDAEAAGSRWWSRRFVSFELDQRKSGQRNEVFHNETSRPPHAARLLHASCVLLQPEAIAYRGQGGSGTRLPNSFQRDDSRATADYTVQGDGSVRVVNTEYRPDGTRKSATGQATVVENSGGGRLRVKFSGLAALVPAAKEGNYWIMALAPDYSAALVGTPDRKFLWLLSRRADMPTEVKERYLQQARTEGFDTSKMISPAAPSPR